MGLFNFKVGGIRASLNLQLADIMLFRHEFLQYTLVLPPVHS